MNNSSFPHNDNVPDQFVVSYELLTLFRWVIEHDVERLKKLIAHYLKDGLKKELENCHALKSAASCEREQNSIVDFFNLLEILMQEVVHEQAVDSVLQKNLMPVIDHIDSTVCDNETIALSVEKASEKLNNNPKIDPQDALFKELLRRWKPIKKNACN